MYMTISKLLFLVLTMGALAPALAAAGVNSSGGGNAIVCRSADTSGTKQIVSATVLDLFEAEAIDGLTIPPRTGNAEDIAGELLKRLEEGNPEAFQNKPVYQSLTALLQSTLANIKVLKPGIGLSPIPNSLSPIVPKGCATEQLAAYQPAGKLLIDGEIWAKLDELNRAGLLVHEVVYKWLRLGGSTNSVRARKIVGALFSNTTIEPVQPPAVTERLFCIDDGSTFFDPQLAYWVSPYSSDPADVTSGIISFIVIGGEPVVSARTVALSNVRPPPVAAPVGTHYLSFGTTKSTFENSEFVSVGSYTEVSESDVRTAFSMEIQNPFGLSGKRLSYNVKCMKR